MNGADLKLWRLEMELTQQELGELLGRSRASINSWENDSDEKVPTAVEAACAALSKRLRMSGKHGAVQLSWHDKALIQPTDRPVKVATLHMERHSDVDTAVERACNLISSKQPGYYGFLILSEAGDVLWNWPELQREARAREKPASRTSKTIGTSKKRVIPRNDR